MRFRFFTLFFLVFAISLPVCAETLPGWKHVALNGSEKINRGVILGGVGGVLYGSPAVADIDNNPDNGLETAIATADGTVNVVSSDGVLLWTANLPNKKCTTTDNTNKSYSSVAIAKLFKNDTNYVVVGYGGIGAKDCGGGVVAYKGTTGKRRFHFNARKFSKKEGFPVPIAHSVFGSPVIVDINKDGFKEIAFGSYDRNVYVLNARGKVVWYYNAADTVWSSGVFAQVNGKGKLELIIGTDITENNFLSPPTKNGGYVYAFKLKIKRVRKIRKKVPIQQFNFQNPKAYIWRTHFKQVIHSSPSIAELDPTNPGLEIVVGSGCYFPENNNNKKGKWLKVLSLTTGEVLKTLDAPVCMTSSPAIGDIDEDGKLEVVAIASGHSSIGGEGKSKVLAWNPEDESLLWEVIPKAGNNDVWAGHFSSPIIADLDGNGSLEVVSANAGDLVVLEGKTGLQLTCKLSNCSLEPNGRFTTGGVLRGTPSVIDVNNDGVLDLIMGGKKSYSGSTYGNLYGWTNLHEYFTSDPGIHPPNSRPWAVHRKSASHNAILK